MKIKARNILIVDDLPERHEGFRKILVGHFLTHAWTYSQATEQMKEQSFDMICLDHDLGDLDLGQASVQINSLNFNLSYTPDYVIEGMYSKSRKYLDGRDICNWMVDYLKNIPSKILIHSANVVAAKEMEMILANHFSTVEVKRMAFRL